MPPVVCKPALRAGPVSPGTPWLRTTVATLGRLGITMAFEIVYLVNSELYPTTLR